MATMEITIDDRTVEAREGETVLQAALRSGIDIPHFCYHPCLSVAGNCRICLVKVDGRPKLVPSCNQPVAAGMTVETESEDVRAARAAVLQFIAIDHPGECGICDKAGECRLQDYQQRYGVVEPLADEPRSRKAKFHSIGDRILLDSERCILCSRCVRFTQEVSGSHLLGIVERGCHARVRPLEGQAFDDPYGDNLVGLCPVGALLSRDFLYKSRPWFLETVPSACTGCSRCCSVDVWRRKPEWRLRALGEEYNRTAYRVTPRDNREINGPWLCNRGYDLHKAMARERSLTARIKGDEVAAEEALAEAARLLAAARKPAAVVAADASNEELAAFKAALGERLTIYTPESRPLEPGEVAEDNLLVRADKRPNGRTLRELFGVRPFDPSAGHDLLLLWGEQTEIPVVATKVIRLAAFAGPEDGADVLIPVASHFERGGSFTNGDGVVSRFEAVFAPPPSVLQAGDVFGRLA